MIRRLSTIALVWLGHAAIATAGPVSVDWSAPAGCPERERVVQRIDRELGIIDEGSQYEAKLAVTHDDATWRLHLAIHRGAATFGERELTGASMIAANDRLRIELSSA